ncbi:Response regulator protein PmrA [Pararobbsia alpina]|uniref:response regulator n=1 Tax=Pararobbsia alpina TaxID=621374 RepID=UPI0039A741F5
MRILLIEDDPMIGETVTDALRRESHAVDWVRDGHEGSLALGHDVYDLIVLDLGLPRRSGIDLLTAFRKDGGTAPVLIMTARDALEDRIHGLDAGADDYLVKPFSVLELAARVRALSRRRGLAPSAVLQHEALTLNITSHEVVFEGKSIALSPREFAVLQALMEDPERVLAKAVIEDKLYGWGQEIESNAIEVHIHSLRRKISPGVIVTVRGVGYRMKAQ